MINNIQNLLQKTINKAGISDQVGAAVLCDEFDKIVLEIIGDKAKGKVRAMYVKNGTLTAAVMSSVMGQEVKLHEHEILEKLNRKAGSNKVQSFRFLV